MQSFRTELENPIVVKDIIDLEQKIRAFREGKIHDEKFRSLRLARGVYGQRQPGVQMIRIKLPFGKVSFQQVLRIADVADEYGSGNLHLTTRQDIQVHYVSLDRSPQLWAELERDDITLREACGNTVRNVTASPDAGINADELFDVTPYAHAVFKYFLRNPICQEMGRKFKIAFSATDKDTAFTYIHDLGFIPRLNENAERGFKVMLGGGLGAQPFLANVVHEFLPENKVIPYIESLLRVFDRYGERTNRNKARLKYLVQKLGLEEVLRLIDEELTANKYKTYEINLEAIPLPVLPEPVAEAAISDADAVHYQQWLDTNVVPQKQEGFYGVYVKVPIGDIKTDRARKLIAAVRPFVADDIRITINQGLLLKFVSKEALSGLFNSLNVLDFATPGFDSLGDITTCPGTDTCNLGISNSMSLSLVLEKVIFDEYPDFIYDKDIKIKISGCMNSCSQHGLAHIGFHGSSVKANGKVVPAVQVLIGGGTVGSGLGRAAERVIKVPTKRAPDVLRAILDDFSSNSPAEQSFHAYYDEKGKDHFYQLLKPVGDLSTLQDHEYVDWGHEETFQTAIGVGECAGVVIDLVATLLLEGEEKLQWAEEAFANESWSDAIYHSYSVFVNTAKALLLDKGINSSTQIGILREFDAHYVDTAEVVLSSAFNGEAASTFSELVLQINKNEPAAEFATAYLQQAKEFYLQMSVRREEQFKS